MSLVPTRPDLLAAIAAWADATPDAPAVALEQRALDYRALLVEIARRAALVPAGASSRPWLVQREDPLDALLDGLAARAAGALPMLIAPGELAPSPPMSWPEGTAWLRATGGTTGPPRLVAMSDAGIFAAAATHAALVGLGPGRDEVVTMPPSTSYGWNAWLGALVSGATVRHVAPQAPRELLARLAVASTVIGCTTPPVVRALARLPARDPLTRAPVICAAAAYPIEAAREVGRRHGVAVLDRYGATETGPIAQARVAGGALYAAPGVSLATTGALDGTATLRVASPAVALGLVGAGAATNGVWQTADRVAFEPDGGLRLLGRVDRVVKRMGRPVDLADLERTFAALPGVALARVRAVPAALDVELHAQVVAAPGATVDGDALLAMLAESAPPWHRPTRLEVVAADGVDPTKWRTAE